MMLTNAQKKALRILHDWKLLHDERGITACAFALKMWPSNPGWHRVHNCGGYGATCGSPMWRLGGSYLSKLAKKGWVLRFFDSTGKQALFRITQKGIDVLVKEGGKC